MADERLLIAGLGNPGSKYDRTRHNAGFLAVDHFAADVGALIGAEKMQGLHGIVRMAGKQIILLKPQTFMNRSGECIIRYVRYFDIQTENILVIHDDLDLEPGRVKIVAGGGAGGHKGILSTISHLGTLEFSRVKIGIGRPFSVASGSETPVEKYVLSRFTDEQWQVFQKNLDSVAEGIRLFIGQGVKVAMNRINTKKLAEQ
jgi:PTH1 family peptidyl-tRNA hydrolase